MAGAEAGTRVRGASGSDGAGGAGRVGRAEAGPARPRAQRADARRNVAALLDAARSTFEEHGVDAPARQVAERAGVGVGTLYRHYPRRSDLIVAVLEHEIDACVEAAAEVAETHEPWDAVVAWISRFTRFVGTKQGLAAALHSGDPAYEGLPDRLLDRLVPPLQALLAAAARTGRLRRDVDPREVMIAVALLSQPVPGAREDFRTRAIDAFLAGLSQDRR